MNFWHGLIIGLFIGTSLGLLVASIFCARKQRYVREEGVDFHEGEFAMAEKDKKDETKIAF